MSLRPGRACLPASRVPRTAPAPTSPVHIFFPKMLEIAGPGVRKRAESCRLTEPEGRARDAAGAADGSGLRRGRSFRPRAESNPTARPPPRSRGESAEPRACCPPAALSPFPGSLRPPRPGSGAGLEPGGDWLRSARLTLFSGPHLAKAGRGSRGTARSSLAWQPHGCSGPPSGGRRSAAAAPTSAAAAFPPSAADQGRTAAVAPGPGAAASRGLQAEGCWSLSRARRGAGAPETDRAAMLESVLRRPRRGYGCWSRQALPALFRGAGRLRQPGRLLRWEKPAGGFQNPRKHGKLDCDGLW
ncbi:translation initiation factor IF-2-like [Camelus ferus]|uniref:Translation initiation factor IF-2-like n=1 Tax=Camelus ferus TaxID=419612 RepID=A0A8B8TF98_CAMFR|nr:translation initiation factor IF-2-like [Camelus ferus]